MKKTLLCVAVSALSILSFSALAGERAKVQTIKLGVPSLAHAFKAVNADNYNAIQQELSQATHAHVSIVRYKDMHKMAHDLADGKIGLAYLKKIPESMAHKKNKDVQTILVAVTKNPQTGHNQTTHDDYVVIKKDSGIQSLKALDNKTMVYWNKFSVSNYGVLQQMLAKESVHVHWLKVASEAAAYQAVMKNKAQAFGVWDYFYETSPHRDQLKILATFKHMDNPVIAMNTAVVSSELKQSIQNQMANAHGPLNVVGFKPVS